MAREEGAPRGAGTVRPLALARAAAGTMGSRSPSSAARPGRSRASAPPWCSPAVRNQPLPDGHPSLTGLLQLDRVLELKLRGWDGAHHMASAANERENEADATEPGLHRVHASTG